MYPLMRTCIALLMSPANVPATQMVEALLLLDRALFLAELPGMEGGTVRLFPLFDPSISPRNLCLTALVKI